MKLSRRTLLSWFTAAPLLVAFPGLARKPRYKITAWIRGLDDDKFHFVEFPCVGKVVKIEDLMVNGSPLPVHFNCRCEELVKL